LRVAVLLVSLLSACGDDSSPADLSAAQDLSADHAVPFRCDPNAQDCPMSQKCTYSDEAKVTSVECVAVTGSVADGQTCNLPGNGDAGVGMDDCAKGLICLPRLSGTRCHKFCHDDSGCTKPQYCNPSAICDDGCAIYASDCPGGYTCAGVQIDIQGHDRAACRPIGIQSLGSACSGPSSCGADAFCEGFYCRAVCDTAHPCASGTCSKRTGGVGAFDESFGVCL
jgi:hypothetical protein